MWLFVALKGVNLSVILCCVVELLTASLYKLQISKSIRTCHLMAILKSSSPFSDGKNKPVDQISDK
jgi:hypothetical protein